MSRLRLDIAYDGTAFHGWAGQPGLRTVQGELEAWIARVLRLEQPPELVCAGRTDAGVHARGQVAHLDVECTDAATTAQMLGRRLRRVLGDDLVVNRVRPAPDGFDARFSAVWRRYVYRLAEPDSALDPMRRAMVVRLSDALDLDAFNAAAASLLGLRDFAAFCRAREGATTVRTLLQARAVRADGLVQVTVRADAFCHSMVRSLVGALVTVGTLRRDAAWLARVADAGVRSGQYTVMPAHGLVLEEVGYPPDDQLAARAEQARQVRVLESGSDRELAEASEARTSATDDAKSGAATQTGTSARPEAAQVAPRRTR